jgi:hypothetical protein
MAFISNISIYTGLTSISKTVIKIREDLKLTRGKDAETDTTAGRSMRTNTAECDSDCANRNDFSLWVALSLRIPIL